MPNDRGWDLELYLGYSPFQSILASSLFSKLILLCYVLITSMGAPVVAELEGQTDPLQIAMKECKWEF